MKGKEMADQRNLVVTGIAANGEYMLVQNSRSGMEVIKVAGVFGGASVRVGFYDRNNNFWQYVIGGPFTAVFERTVALGQGENLVIEITGASVTTNIEFRTHAVQ